MQIVGERKGELVSMDPRGNGITHCIFKITSRALIGMRGRILTSTSGEAIMHHTFLEFVPVTGERPTRHAGVMVNTADGQITEYAVVNLHERGIMLLSPGVKVYAGQVVGEHNRAKRHRSQRRPRQEARQHACRLQRRHRLDQNNPKTSPLSSP